MPHGSYVSSVVWCIQSCAIISYNSRTFHHPQKKPAPSAVTHPPAPLPQPGPLKPASVCRSACPGRGRRGRVCALSPHRVSGLSVQEPVSRVRPTEAGDVVRLGAHCLPTLGGGLWAMPTCCLLGRVPRECCAQGSVWPTVALPWGTYCGAELLVTGSPTRAPEEPPGCAPQQGPLPSRRLCCVTRRCGAPAVCGLGGLRGQRWQMKTRGAHLPWC